MIVFKQTKSCRVGFLILIGASFLIGFIAQILFSFKSHHVRPNLHEKSNAKRDSSSEVAALIYSDGMLKSASSLQDISAPGVADDTSINSNGLFLTAVEDANVPNIVRSWRTGKLDWHALLPAHNSVWERFGTPDKGKGLRLLVSKEMQVTDFLTQYHQSGLSSKYGKNHGSLLDYSACNSFQSACMIHDALKCSVNQLCSWSSLLQLCVDRDDKDADPVITPVRSCPSPMTIRSDGALAETEPDKCRFYVDQAAVFINLDSESQSMFFHWWASWSTVMSDWRKTHLSSRQIHYFVEVITDPTFFDYFGFISDNCWRRSTQSFVQAPKGTCFCNTYRVEATQWGVNPGEISKQITSYLELSKVEPPKKKVKIGIISRRVKRFILNEYELVAAVEKMGYICVLLPLERMTLFEQVREFRTLDVLIGIHGSALDNSVFLHPGMAHDVLHPTFPSLHIHLDVSHSDPLVVTFHESNN